MVPFRLRGGGFGNESGGGRLLIGHGASERCALVLELFAALARGRGVTRQRVIFGALSVRGVGELRPGCADDNHTMEGVAQMVRYRANTIFAHHF